MQNVEQLNNNHILQCAVVSLLPKQQQLHGMARDIGTETTRLSVAELRQFTLSSRKL